MVKAKKASYTSQTLINMPWVLHPRPSYFLEVKTQECLWATIKTQDFQTLGKQIADKMEVIEQIEITWGSGGPWKSANEKIVENIYSSVKVGQDGLLWDETLSKQSIHVRGKWVGIFLLLTILPEGHQKQSWALPSIIQCQGSFLWLRSGLGGWSL